jgi:hypothetical protein
MANPADPFKRPADREELSLNPIYGKLDLVRQFNPDRIITAERNSAGHLLKTFDPETGTYLEDAPQVVTDRNGNVVTV